MKYSGILILFFGIFLHSISFAACTALFNYSNPNNSLDFQFLDLSTSDDQIVHYYWDLGDGNTSTESNPHYIYEYPGYFRVSLTIISSGSCVSSYETIVCAGMIPSPDTCLFYVDITTHNATYPTYQNGWISLDVDNELVSYQWSTGENSPIIFGLEPGHYTVTVTDIDGCFYTQSIEIGYNNNCYASIIVDTLTYSHTPGAVLFNNNSTGEAYSYFWDFGDGTVSRLRNPLHIYENTGTYYVCLYLITYYGCYNYYCCSVEIHENTPEIDLLGTVYVGNTLLPRGMAVLYHKQGNKYIADENVLINDGCFLFNALDPSKAYTVYAIPEFGLDQVYFPKYIPTYIGGECKWQNSSNAQLPNQNDYEIHLLSNQEILYGNGLIEGSIYFNDESSYEENVFHTTWFDSINPISEELAANVVVLLYNNNMEVLDFKLSNNLGHYSFNNLPFGTYTITGEKAGLISQELTITISEEQAEVVVNDLIIRNSSIQTETNLVSNTSAIKIYPNPVSDKLIIQNSYGLYNELIIYSSQAKEILRKPIIFGDNAIDVSDCRSGVYLVVLSGDEEVYSRKVIIKP